MPNGMPSSDDWQQSPPQCVRAIGGFVSGASGTTPRLFDNGENMENAKVCAAMVRAQKAFGAVLKTKVNPAFKSRYADLDACIDAVIDALNAEGIALVQRPIPGIDSVTVETLFVHESGEVFSGGVFQTPVVKKDPQGFGGALTYARRYSLMAACGIAPEDDDGNAASGRTEQKPQEQQRQRAEQKPTPAQVAANVTAGVKNGDAAGAAEFLSSLPERELQSVWDKIDTETQKLLNAAWPKGAGE